MTDNSSGAAFAFTKLVVRDLAKADAFYRAVCGYGEGEWVKATTRGTTHSGSHLPQTGRRLGAGSARLPQRSTQLGGECDHRLRHAGPGRVPSAVARRRGIGGGRSPIVHRRRPELE